MATQRRKLKRKAGNMQKIKEKIADLRTTRLMLHVEKAADLLGPMGHARLEAVERLIPKYEALLTAVGNKR